MIGELDLMPATTVPVADAGPLGFAAIATADANPNDSTPGHAYPLFSALIAS